MLARFERDRSEGPVDLREYLPPVNDPAYSAVVTELCRIDLEHDFNAGQKSAAVTARSSQTFTPPRAF